MMAEVIANTVVAGKMELLEKSAGRRHDNVWQGKECLSFTHGNLRLDCHMRWHFSPIDLHDQFRKVADSMFHTMQLRLGHTHSIAGRILFDLPAGRSGDRAVELHGSSGFLSWNYILVTTRYQLLSDFGLRGSYAGQVHDFCHLWPFEAHNVGFLIVWVTIIKFLASLENGFSRLL